MTDTDESTTTEPAGLPTPRGISILLQDEQVWAYRLDYDVVLEDEEIGEIFGLLRHLRESQLIQLNPDGTSVSYLPDDDADHAALASLQATFRPTVPLSGVLTLKEAGDFYQGDLTLPGFEMEKLSETLRNLREIHYVVHAEFDYESGMIKVILNKRVAAALTELIANVGRVTNAVVKYDVALAPGRWATVLGWPAREH